MRTTTRPTLATLLGGTLAFLLGAPAPPAAACPPPAVAAAAQVTPAPAASFDPTEVEARVHVYVNRVRLRAGLPRLALNPRLTWSARDHSQEMFELRYLSHTSPVPAHRDLTDRLRRVGLTWFRTAAENLAWYAWSGYQQTADDIARQFVQQWMESPGHRAAILDPAFTLSGVGVWGGDGEVYATQHFAALHPRLGDRGA